jgi:hypothetical protein
VAEGLLFVRWAWRWGTLAAFGDREDGDAAVAGWVDGADGENYVVFRDGQLEGEGGACAGEVGPGWLVGFAPDDLVCGAGGGADGRLPAEFGVVVEGRGEDVDVLGFAGCGGESGEGGGVEAGYVGDIAEVDVLQEIAELSAVFYADVLVLVVEVLGPLGEANGGEALLIEGAVVAAAEEAVAAEDENGVEGRDHAHGHVAWLAGGRVGGQALRGGTEVGGADVDDGAGELAGGGVAFGAEGLDGAELVGGGVGGDAFGEDADGGLVLDVGGCGVAGGGVPADDVVVEDSFELPVFFVGEFGEVGAAVEALLFSGYGNEDDGAGEFEFAEDAGGFEGDGDSAGVVVGAGGGVVGVGVGGVAGVVVAGNEDHAGGLGGVGAAEDGVDVADFGGLGDAGVWCGAGGLGEGVALYFEAVVAGGGDGFELGLDPVGGGVDAGVGGEVGVHAGEGAAVVEGDEFGDGGFDVVGGDLGEGGGDGGVGWGGGDGAAGGEGLLGLRGLLGVEQGAGEDGGGCEEGEGRACGAVGCCDHESSPLCKTEVASESYA